MTPKPPFLSASDYVFYIKKNSEQEIEPSIQKHNKMSTLLRKLVDDIVEGPIGFVEDFIEEPNEGISALLDYLKISLNRQQSPISMPYNSMMSNELNKFQNSNYNQAQRNRDRQQLMKRAMADEFDCLQCLKFAISRNDITLNKILNHKSGLTSIGSCIVSSLAKSRIIALEILTKICNVQPEGYSKVLEAMTIMRILFGESVRFKLLVALVNSNNMNYVQKLNYRNESSTDTNSESDIQVNNVQFELVVLRFINALLANAQPAQRVRLQTEIEEAGFSINFIEQKLNHGLQESQESKIKYEINNYKKLYIDIVKLMLDCQQALQRECDLKEDIDNLHYTLVKIEKEKIDLLHEKEELKERCADLENKLNKFKNRCSNSNSSLESNPKKCLTNANKESNRSVSDISNNHSVNSDSGRWSTSDSEEGILISNSIALSNGKSNNKITKQQQDNKNDELIKNKQQEIIKKPSYFKLNLMNKKNKEISLTKFKQTKSKSDQNLEDYKDENQKENHNNTLSNKNGENVRNEDIFIYVPTIREKNNIKLNHNESNKLNSRIFEQQQTNNCINKLNRFNSMNCDLGDWSTNKTKPDLNKKDNLNKSQSNISSNSSTSSQKSNKPQILKVYPKRSNSIGELLNSDQSRNSDEDKEEDEEIKKLFYLRKQTAKSSSTLKSSDDRTPKLNNNRTYKSNLQNSIDTLSTNNSGNLTEEETNLEDYEELIASTLQQKRIKDNNKTIWINNDTHLSNNNDKIKNNNNLRGSKLYASFANGQLINDKFKSDYNNPTLFRTGQYYNMNNINNHKSTSNLSNTSSTHSNSALIHGGEFYLMKGRQSSTNSLNFNNLDNLEKFESLPPSIYGKHLNTISKDKYRKTPQSEQSIQSNLLLNSQQQQQQQNKKEHSSTGKKLASQIQSYFFSGSLSNKKKNENDEKSKTLNNKLTNKLSNVNKQINDLNERFPLPNVYKKNFILKGHQNVGLYSNKLNLPQDDLILNSLNTADLHKENDNTFKSTEQLNSLNIHELKTKSSKPSKSFKNNRPKITKNDIQLKPDSMINLGKLSLTNNADLNHLGNSMSDLNLLHREIALAAKEIGALY